ncbi:MAG: hypothetical protein ACI835_002504 [Planctomycetota bacterium]|jgi:hypothetical protein
MTIFDGIVTALLEGLWTILFHGLFMAPGRVLSHAWGARPDSQWSSFWAFYAALVFWIGMPCMISLIP